MEKPESLTLNRVCTYYQISPDFLTSLEEYELIEIHYQADTGYLNHDQIARLERFIRLNTDLGINVQGLSVIYDLLEERSALRTELNRLRRNLSLFER